MADQIQRELGDLLREVKDPRVAHGLLTVSGVDVSPDLRNARVYITALACEDPAAAVAGLNDAAGFLRGRLARRLRMRGVPVLRFRHDETPEKADRVTRLLRDTPTDES